jgi:transcriptional regulator of met regulon
MLISLGAVAIMIPALVISIKRERVRRRIERMRHTAEA